MALSIALHAVSAENSNVATHSALLPATVAAGNLLELRVASNDVCIFKAPTGWTLTDEHTEGNSAGAIFHKIADGSESGTYVTFTTRDTGDTTDVLTQTAHLSTVVIDWNGSLVSDIAVSIPGHTSSTNPDANIVTPPWGAEDTLFIVSSHIRRGTSQTVDTYPTGYTDNQLVSATTTGSGGAQVAIASRILNAASNDPDPFSLSASTNAISYVTAIRPVQVNTDPQLDTPEPDFSAAANVSGVIGSVAGNMSDADSDPLTYSIVSGAPAGVTMTANGDISSTGALTEGAYTITYQGDDGRGGTPAQDTFVLTVTAPVFRIDSATTRVLTEGDILTFYHSSANATGKTLTVEGQTISPIYQDADKTQVVIPDLKVFGNQQLTYNVDLTFEINDGGDTDSIVRQIAPKPGHGFASGSLQLTGFNDPSIVPGLAVEDEVYGYFLGDDGQHDVQYGAFQSYAGGTFRVTYRDATDGTWGPSIDRTVPPTYAFDVTLLQNANRNNALIGEYWQGDAPVLPPGYESSLVIDSFEDGLYDVNGGGRDLWNHYDDGGTKPGSVAINNSGGLYGSNTLTATGDTTDPYLQFYPYDGGTFHWLYLKDIIDNRQGAGTYTLNKYNRLRFWVKYPSGTSFLLNGNKQTIFGTYLRDTDGTLTSAETDNMHFYHFYDIGYMDGEWHQVIVDWHVNHQRSASGSTEHGEKEHPAPFAGATHNYFDLLTRFYFEQDHTLPSSYIYDGFELYEETANEDVYGIYSVHGVYNPNDNTIHVGWSRRKDYSGNWDVVYAFEDIHTLGFDNATPAPSGTNMSSPTTNDYNQVHYRTTAIDVSGQIAVYIAMRRVGEATFRQIRVPVNSSGYPVIGGVN